MQPWPKEALHSVGVKFLKEIDLGSDAVREGVEKFMPFSFDSALPGSRTPHTRLVA